MNMNIGAAKSRRTPTTSVVLPDDLIAEVLSFLPVKSLLQFKCVNKSWKTLISDSAFVKFHLNRSSTRNPHFTVITDHITFHPPCGRDTLNSLRGRNGLNIDSVVEFDCWVVPYPVRCLLENPSFTVSTDPYYSLKGKDCSEIVGTCNGLICLSGYSIIELPYCKKYWLRLWNPASRQTSPKVGYFCTFRSSDIFKFKFGCDNSTGTYKVVAYAYNRHELKNNVRILNLNDDAVWRDIESFPVVPLNLDNAGCSFLDGVYCSGTLNWLAIHNNNNNCYYKIEDITTVEQLVIVSLDLGTETYRQYKLPCEFDELPPTAPTVGVLGGYFCFSYSYRQTNFVIWQMKKFGAEDSWTQFLKISYQNLQMDYDLAHHFQLVPLLLFEDGDTLILTSSREKEAILYNWRDNKVERRTLSKEKQVERRRIIVSKFLNQVNQVNQVTRSSIKDYVESLVSIF